MRGPRTIDRPGLAIGRSLLVPVLDLVALAGQLLLLVADLVHQRQLHALDRVHLFHAHPGVARSGSSIWGIGPRLPDTLLPDTVSLKP
jgi:hypothetical protein